jgi:hypothetical protein
MSTRETWLNGWRRDGDMVWCECAGCGKYLGGSWGMREGYPTKGPEWPFDAETCPVCELRDKVIALQAKLDTPQDKLTARLEALHKRAP